MPFSEGEWSKKRKLYGRVCALVRGIEYFGPSLRPSVGLPRASSTSQQHQISHTGDEMGDNPLTSRREVYFEGPSSTELNTVDIWTAGSDLASENDGRVWVVSVPASYSLLSTSPC